MKFNLGSRRPDRQMDAKGPSAREVVVFSALALLFVASELAIVHGQFLFTRYLWLDEHLTSLIALDPSLNHAIAAVKGGVDTNPPVFHLLLRGFVGLLHLHGPAGLRAFAILCVWIALVATYAVLRRSFGVGPAVIGCLIVWSHPIVLDQAFQARFYGSLLMGAALFCLTYGQALNRPRRPILTALASIFLCTIHYFGIIALAAIVMADFLANRRPFRETIGKLVPVSAGPLALFLFLPFYFGQSKGLSVRSWVEPFSAGGAGKLLESVFRSLGAVAVALLWWVSELYLARSGAGKANGARNNSDSIAVPTLEPVAGMSGLLIIPFVLVGISAVAFSVLVPRYAIAAVLGMAPPAALLAVRTLPPLRIVSGLLLAALSLLDLSHIVHVERAWQAEQIAMVKSVRGTDDLPIVAFSREEAYMICYVAAELAPRVMILDLRPGYRDQLSNYIVYENEAETKVRRFYDMPPLVTLDQLQALGPFHLVPHAGVTGNDLPPLDHLPLRQINDSIYAVK